MVELPPGLSARASEVIETGEAGVETMSSLVAEALGQYLERLEAASRLPDSTSEKTSPETARGSLSSRRFSETGEELTLQMSSRTTVPTELREIPSREDEIERNVRPARRRSGLEQRDDLLGIDEISHPGAGEMFERTIEAFDRARDELEPVLADSGIDEGSYQRLRDEVLVLGSIVPASTRLDPAPGSAALDAPHDRPLFGLHNRDYPSLWGLMLLARAAAEGPVPWSEFASGLELTARAYGGPLRIMDEVERPKRGLKYSASFPDPWKEAKGGQWIAGEKGRKTARLYPFVKNTFARIQKGRGGMRTVARGPLPRWNAVQFLERDGLLLVEPTPSGYELLEVMAGVSLSLPHPPRSAKDFLSFLSEESPGDAEAFLRVLNAIDVTGEREEVVEFNLDYFDQFLDQESESGTSTFASTMTQGYIARGREWGLVEADMAPSEDGRKIYVLTESGHRAIEQLADAGRSTGS